MKYLLFLFVLSQSFEVYSQDTIAFDHNEWDDYYSIGGDRIDDLNELISVVGSNPIALQYAQKAQGFKFGSAILLCTSILTVSAAAGPGQNSLEKDRLKWYGISALTISAGLMSYHVKNKNEERAVREYNKSRSAKLPNGQLDVILSMRGFGIKITF